ncbi:hypothetical protein SCHPADRAFT_995903 [Schizopora paradoxa]|uniref:Uncharacterized protein n=1 Tax=Schizopora paradoxa TaxID=27342 RepID=A0A0H2SEH1_9AGAM|nr:hypothetical protein SCHPADRAFT_995903 [Schizopora paradoxa]
MHSSPSKALESNDLLYLIGVLQKLNNEGGRLGGDDRPEVWHDVHLPYDAENFHDARKALVRMKAALKTLGTVTASLERSIKSLSRHCIEEGRAVGFASLPDELLARVFEFYCEEYQRFFSCETEYTTTSPMTLSKVCRRFRRIIMHIPRVWACVSLKFDSERIHTLRTRCNNPIVYLASDCESSEEEFVKFFNRLPSSNQWRGLNLEFVDKEDGCLLFETLDSQGSSFDALESLSISFEGYGDMDGNLPRPLFPKKCEEILSKWDMPVLEELELRGIIPSGKMKCSNLKRCKIFLGNFVDHKVKWDFNRFQKFIHSKSLASIESLTILLDGTQPTNGAFVIQQHPLFKLKELELFVDSDTNPTVLKQIMDIIDAPNLKTLKIKLSYLQYGDIHLPIKWLFAIFRTSEGAIRTFPNVLELKLSVELNGISDYPFDPMLRSLPRLKSLTMSIPGIRVPDFSSLRRNFGCIQELESLDFKNCLAPGPWNILNYLNCLNRHDEYAELKDVKLRGCCGLREYGYKDEIIPLLGEKLTWKC